MIKLKNHKIMLFLAAIFLLQVIPFNLYAKDTGIPWESLSQYEQTILKPYSARWEKLQPEKQLNLQRGAARWSELTSGQRMRLKKKLRVWRNMTPKERKRARIFFKKFCKLPLESKKGLDVCSAGFKTSRQNDKRHCEDAGKILGRKNGVFCSKKGSKKA